MTAKNTHGAATEESSEIDDRASRAASARYMLDEKECALLLLRVIQEKESESGKLLSRFRVAEISLRRMWGRHRITREFIDAVNEWLLRAGRTLFFAGNSYGVIMTSAVESWSRLSSKRIATEIDAALTGAYDFVALEGLLNGMKGDGLEEDS